MFSTLIQNKVNNGIMDVMHDHLTRITKNVIYIKPNYVKLGLHGNNSLSKLNPNDKLIKKYEFFLDRVIIFALW